MNVANAYVQEARCEILRYLRNPGFLLPIILFPAAFYLMFGVALAEHSAPGAARYLLASYSTFGVMAPGLFGFGVSLALERDSGLLTLKRALPMPPGAYLLGKMLMAMVVAAVVGVLLLKGQGAPGLLNLVYLPMAFLSGLWFPLKMMPPILGQLAPLWPSYHLNMLALSAVGFDTGAGWPRVLVLAGFTAVFLLVASRRLQRYG